MKNSSEYVTRINKLYNRIVREGGAAPPDSRELMEEFVLACLCEYTSQQQAEKILTRLMHEFVDFNEMRVCRPGEIIDVIHTLVPQAEKIRENIILLLKGLFDHTDTLSLDELQDKGKKDAKHFIEKLEGGSPFVTARILLRGLGVHAFPVSEAIVNMLKQEDGVDPQSDLAAVQAFLERNVSAGKTLKMYSAFQHYADHYNSASSDEKKSQKKPKAEKAVKARKTTKTAKKKKA